jgi:hypothetical protein
MQETDISLEARYGADIEKVPMEEDFPDGIVTFR